MQHVIYILFMIALAVSLPAFYFDPDARQFIFIIGVVAMWRYTWAIQHFLRALTYSRKKFPAIRAEANKLGEDGKPDHVFFLITSFRIGCDVSTRVYREAVREAVRCGVPATIIASIVEMSDERLVKQLFYALDPPIDVDLKLVRIAGTGKRDGLAAGFRALCHEALHLENSIVLVIDGDSILTPGICDACFPLFKLNPKLGALTTDEECHLVGDDLITSWYRQWYNLRFAQRAVYMGSMALSNRVLTLTGRMSMFRGDIVGDPEFIALVECDHIDHWRLGRFRFLTGDDKSTWYQVLKDGWEMTYVPDARVLTVEEPPHRNFFKGATMLMRRWFGNMLRTNARARQLPRKTTGLYTWWCLIDQRVSMWTSLFGLTVAIMGSFKVGGALFAGFMLWIMMTRYVMTIALSYFHPGFNVTWPFLIYFNQVYGSLVKIYMLTHLHKQTWTRQKTTLRRDETRWHHFMAETGSNISWATAMLLFLIPLATYVGIVTAADWFRFWVLMGNVLSW
jgi:glycosyltransferase Alg8